MPWFCSKRCAAVCRHSAAIFNYASRLFYLLVPASLRRPPGASTGGAHNLFGQLAEMAMGLALSHLLQRSGMLQGDGNRAPAYQQQFYDSARERQLHKTLERLGKALPDQERYVVRSCATTIFRISTSPRLPICWA